MNKKFKYKKSLLAAILSATLLAGCDGGGSGSSSDTPPVDSGTGSLPEVKPDPTPNPEPTPEPTPDPEPTPEPTPVPEVVTEQTPSGIKVEVKAGTYTTTADVNLRADASTDAQQVSGAAAGTQLTGTGVCENGWIRVEYEGQVCYVSGDFVTPAQ